MPNRFLFVLLLFPILLQGQSRRGNLMISDDFSLLQLNEPSQRPFSPENQVFLRSPYFEYFFHNNLSIGGDFSYFYHKRYISSSKTDSIHRIEFFAQLKWYKSLNKMDFYLTAAGKYYRNRAVYSTEISDWSAYIGTGIQLNINPFISWETQALVPFITNTAYSTIFDLITISRFKFLINSKNDLQKDGYLSDRYLRKYNSIFTFNISDFRSIAKSGSIFTKFDASAGYFYKHHSLLYFNAKYKKVLDKNINKGDFEGYRISLGSIFYIPLPEQIYLVLKTGIIATNTDYNFSYQLKNAIGFQTGIHVHHFLDDWSIFKLGLDWDLVNVENGNRKLRYSNFLPGVAFEFLLNNQMSIEPKIYFQVIKTERGTIDPFKAAEDSILFEIKFNALFLK